MKNKIKKYVLILSCFPYIYVFLKGIYYSIFGYENYGNKGLDALIDYLSGDVIGLAFEVSAWVIFIPCVVYQFYYFINVRGNKDNSIKDNNSEISVEQEEKRTEKRKKIRKVWFVIALMCWGLYLLSGVYAFFFGYDSVFFSTTKEYGFEGLFSALFWNIIILSIIPILPISLIYIIVYIISNVIKKKKEKE